METVNPDKLKISSLAIVSFVISCIPLLLFLFSNYIERYKLYGSPEIYGYWLSGISYFMSLPIAIFCTVVFIMLRKKLVKGIGSAIAGMMISVAFLLWCWYSTTIVLLNFINGNC